MKIGRKKRSKKMSIGKLLIWILVIFVVIFAIVLLSNKTEKNENIEINYEEENLEKREFGENPDIIDENKLYEERNVDGFLFSNVNVEYKYNNTYFTITVKNNGSDMYESKNMVISFLDQFGGIMHDFDAKIPALKNGESTEITLISITDYSDVYDIEIKVDE